MNINRRYQLSTDFGPPSKGGRPKGRCIPSREGVKRIPHE